MFIKRTYSKNHVYLSLVETFRENGKVRHKTLYQFGRLDDLEKSGQIRRLIDSLEKAIGSKSFNLESMQEKQRLNWGAPRVYRTIWNKFELGQLLESLTKRSRAKFSLSEVIFLMVVSQLHRPSSKLKMYQHQDDYIELEKVSLQHLYRALDLLADNKEELEWNLFEKNRQLFNMQVDVVFYDVTTLYFESVLADDLKNFGYSKDKKFNEVQVGLGLLIDSEGRPIGFDVYPGNTFEGHTLETALQKLKQRFSIREVIIVGDQGVNSKQNLLTIKKMGFDYIVGSRLKIMPKKIQDQIINRDNYQTLKIDEEDVLETFELNYQNVVLTQTPNNQRRKKTILQEKLHCSWSDKRAKHDQAKRERLVERATTILNTGAKAALEQKRGAKRYIISESKEEEKKYLLDQAKIEKDKAWDGFYGIQTSRLSMTGYEVYQAYRRLWRIERAFRVLKSTLNMRPMFHWTPKRIRGHLVVCFLAFLLQRTLEISLSDKKVSCSPDSIRSALDSLQLSVIKHEKQLFYLRSPVNGLANKILRALKISIPKSVCSPDNF